MGKRSDFARVERDFYRTPAAAVTALLPHLNERTTFVEPCAGDGALVDHLQAAGHRCTYAVDIEPQWPIACVGDATSMRYNMGGATHFITNPPWTRSILHPLIVNLSDQAPTWLLFDADWVHTVQAIPFLPRLRIIQSIGRVKWIPGSKMTGKDNCSWHLFTQPCVDEPPIFFGRSK